MPRLSAFVIMFVALITAVSARAEPQDRPGPGTPSAQAPATGLIVGQVIDAQSGRGVAGALVSLTGGPGGSAGGASGIPSGFPSGLERSDGLRRVLATPDGRFVFRDLAAGSYSVTARKSGYLEGSYGRRIPAGTARSVVLAAGERVGAIDIAIWKYAAITGTVTDEAGEPVIGIEARALRRTIIAGRRQFTEAGTATTDDRGIYRLRLLIPGDYIVAIVSTQVAVPAEMLEEVRRSVESQDTGRSSLLRAIFEAGASTSWPGAATAVQVDDMVQSVPRSYVPPPQGPDGTMFVYPTMFFPSSGSPNDVGVVSVGSGEERAGADFQLKPVPAFRISGQVLSPEGPVQGIVLRLVSAESGEFSRDLDAASTVSAGDGSFVFMAVPAGSYVLRAQRTPRPAMPNAPRSIVHSGGSMTIVTPAARVEPQMSNGPTLWARMPITVEEGPLTGVEVPLQTGARVGGRVVFDGATVPPKGDDLTRLTIVADTLEGRASRILLVDRFGRFTSQGLAGGKYFLRAAGAPSGWVFKGAMLDGRDVSDLPLELGSTDISTIAITFTDRPTTLAGTVRTDQGAPDPEATVLVFPIDTRMWTGHGAMSRRFRSARAGTTGAYTLTGLPAGSYAVIAVPDEQTADWQDPGNLETLARRATRVEIADERNQTRDLTVDR